MPLPLQGIRVIELCVWVAGPTCARILGELGADVIKVENPRGGDPGRSVIAEKTDTNNNPVISPHWELWNGSKRSITLDLRQDEGKEIFMKLLKTADVFPPISRALFIVIASRFTSFVLILFAKLFNASSIEIPQES